LDAVQREFLEKALAYYQEFSWERTIRSPE
jgi:hypothetical protein